jgi:hypothetical protein
VTVGPLEIAARIIAILDEIGIPYALGGSVASSLVGEPRATADADVAIRLSAEHQAAILERAHDAFYVPDTRPVPRSEVKRRSRSSTPRTA